MMRSERAPATQPSLPVLAVWFGVIGGLSEVAIHALRRFVRQRFVFLTDDIIWLAPLAVVCLLLSTGGLVWLVQRARRRSPDRVLIPLFVFLTTLGVLLSYPRLHWGADLVIAAGVAYQGTRMIRRRQSRVNAVIRRTVPILVLLVVVLGGSLRLSWMLAGPTASTPDPASPNVILLILDTVRGLDFAGHSALDSYLVELAKRARTGIRYDRAFAASSWTLPSHSTLFTGRWPREHRANWNTPLDDRYPTLAEELSRRGYRTGGFVGNKMYAARSSGLARGFHRYEDFIIGPGELLRASSVLRGIGESLPLRGMIGWFDGLGRKNAEGVTGGFLKWLDQDPERPFFAFLNYFDVHSPYLPPPPYDQALRDLGAVANEDPGRRFRVKPVRGMLPPEVLRESRVAYEGTLRYLDHQVARLLDSLEHRGILDNTVVILTSDHGEEFGEHQSLGHGRNVYRSTIQVPLIIWIPGDRAGGLVETPVSLRDLPSTIMALVDPHSTNPFPGRSLLPTTARRADSIRAELVWQPGIAKEYAAGNGDVLSWIVDSRRTIRYPDGRTEEFDVFGDPLERNAPGPVRMSATGSQ